MDRPRHSSLVATLNELSWSDVKQMAIHLDDSVDLTLLKDIEREYPIEERLMYTMKAWLERDCEASWAKVVSAVQRIGQNVLAKKIEITAAKPITAPCTVKSPDPGPEGDQPVVSPPVKLQPSPGLTFLHQKNEASACASLAPVLDHSCTDSHDVSGGDRTKTHVQVGKIDEEHQIRSITAPSPVTLRGQTERGPPIHVVSRSSVELQPSPGLDSFHQLQPENEATVIRTRLEPESDHGASRYVSEDGDSDKTRAQETTEQETSDCLLKKDSEISGWTRERRQTVSHVAVMAAIVGAALATAESEDDIILLVLACTGFIAALVAFGVKLFILIGVSTGLRKLAVFAAGAAVVVAVLVGAGTARMTAITTARTAETASRATVATVAATASDSVTAADRSVILLAVHGIIVALGTAAFAVLTAEAVLPVLVTVVVAVMTIGAGAGVKVAAAVVAATAGVMAVAAAGATTAKGPSQAAAAAEARAAAAAVAALAVAVVTAAVGAPILTTAAVGLAAVVAVAAAAVVAVGSFPAVRLPVAVTVGTVVVAETAVMTAMTAVALGKAAALAFEAAAVLATILAAAFTFEAAAAAFAAAAAVALGAVSVAGSAVLVAAGAATAAVAFGVAASAEALGLAAAVATVAAAIAIATVALELAFILNYYS